MAQIKVILSDGFKMSVEHKKKTESELIAFIEKLLSGKEKKVHIEKKEAYFVNEIKL